MDVPFEEYEFENFVDLSHRFGAAEARRRLARFGDPVLDAIEAERARRSDAIQRGYPPMTITNGRGGSWYVGSLADHVFWPALRRDLEGDRVWKEGDLLDRLDSSSSKVLQWTPDPSQQTWKGRGLVVGYVQSGKTTNFTAVIAKAADVGYNLVIVLSGIHNGLRRQTQERLDAQLCDLNPDDWVSLTSQDRDFHSPTMTLESLVSGMASKKTVLCVVKKNAAVLEKVLAWLGEAKRRGGLSSVKALVIDDEADQASVATARINPLVREILNCLPRCTFIGYTATPFANVLIDPASDDLYPSDFILNLPRPDNYFGPEFLFGRDEVEGSPRIDGYDMIRNVDDDEAQRMRPRRGGVFAPAVAGALERAVRWFWMATAARRVRSDRGHATMLVHTSMQTSAHEALRLPLLAYRTRMVDRLENDTPVVLDELRRQWDDEVARVPASDFGLSGVEFDAVAGALPGVVAATTVVMDNCKSLDRLDYSNGTVTAIAVGGNTLSRGLTLEGLTVSYFVRSASAYDTLLQMGRWFGFRRGYEDLPRIWMTGDLARWFRHLATVEHELRKEIELYEHAEYRPIEVGPRIRTHPSLLVTTKMGAARVAAASFGGQRVQTHVFKESDKEWLAGNFAAAAALVDVAVTRGKEEEAGEAVLFRDVPADAIFDFLSAYRVHEDSPEMQTQLICDYIAGQRTHGSLESWSVGVVGGATDATVELGGRRFNCVARSKLLGTGGDRADIKTLMSKEHRVLDLEIQPSIARQLPEYKLMTMRNDDEIAFARGLLVLYPIDPNSEPLQANTDTREPLRAVGPVIGMAMVFPGNANDSVYNRYIQVDSSCVAIEDASEEQESAIRSDTEDDVADDSDAV